MNDIAFAQEVQKAVKARFHGNKRLKSKVKTQFPDNLVREYTRITNTYMTLMNKVLSEKLPIIRKAMDSERAEMRHDAARSVRQVIESTFFDIHSEFEKRINAFGLDKKIKDLSEMERRRLTKEWKRVVKHTLGIDLLGSYYNGELFENVLKRWVDTNVSLIKSIPQETLNDMRNIIEEGYLSGLTNSVIAERIQDTYGTNRGYAQFVARDQMANLNASLTEAQQRDAGVKEYTWRSSGDQRVRDCHSEYDGKRFSWDDPPEQWYETKSKGRVYVGRAHPGQFYQCRCVAIPVFDIETVNLPMSESPGGA